MWEINISNQFLTLLYSICLGAILCFFYDFLRASRKTGFNSFIAVFITDILFWIISAFVTFIFLMSRTNGEIRGYVLVGQLIGFVISRLTVSRFILLFFVFLFNLIKNLNRLLNKAFNVVYSKTDKILLKIFKIIKKTLKTLIKSIKKLLKNRHKLLYTNVNNYDAEYVFNETEN